MERAKLYIYNLLLICAGCWFCVELLRSASSILSGYRLRWQLGIVTLPLVRGGEWPLGRAQASNGARLVVFALSSTCQVCVNSIDFYRKVLRLSHQADAPFGVLILLERGTNNSAFIDKLGAQRAQVIETDLTSRRIRTTPTVWVVSRGKVIEVFEGGASPVEEGYLVGVGRGLLTPASEQRTPGLPFHLSSAGLEYAETGKMAVQIIDIQDRRGFQLQHRPNTLNIPADELYPRARAELSSAKWTVIDCTLSDARVCDRAAYVLGSVGFLKLSVLNRATTPGTAPAR